MTLHVSNTCTCMCNSNKLIFKVIVIVIIIYYIDLRGISNSNSDFWGNINIVVIYYIAL